MFTVFSTTDFQRTMFTPFRANRCVVYHKPIILCKWKNEKIKNNFIADKISAKTEYFMKLYRQRKSVQMRQNIFRGGKIDVSVTFAR